METSFSKEQLKDKDNKSSEKIFRKCVHCGFCNSTCPTYQLLGDELDGPRGRIYMIKDMLENNKPASKKIVKHIEDKTEVEILAIGIGHDVSRYYNRAIKITDVNELGDVMISQLGALFDKKNKLH